MAVISHRTGKELTISEVEEVEDLPHEGRLHELLQLHLARVLLRERPLQHRLEVRRVLKSVRSYFWPPI